MNLRETSRSNCFSIYLVKILFNWVAVIIIVRNFYFVEVTLICLILELFQLIAVFLRCNLLQATNILTRFKIYASTMSR
jgi:hypothetical protein